jgi:Ca2+/Na+ antiporter
VDLSSNTKTAWLGLPSVALSACYGSSSLVMLLGMGPSFLIALAVLGHPYVIPAAAFTPSLYMAFASLGLAIVFLALAIPLSGFRTRSWMPVLLLILYFCASAAILGLDIVYGK